MLISFSVQNFRSIYHNQQVTLIASKFASFSEGILKSKQIPSGVLPLVAIYGANASGKSNLLKALSFLGEAVAHSQNRWHPDGGIHFEPHFFHREEPTQLTCEFLLNRNIYTLAITYNEEGFASESLHLGRTLMYRRNKKRYKLGAGLGGFESSKKITRTNSLFISALAQNNHPLATRIQAWFTSWDTITDNRTIEEALTGHLVLDQGNAREFLARAMSIVNPDIISIEPGTLIKGELLDSLPVEDSSLYRHHLQFSRTKFVHKDPGSDRTASILISEESRGTQCYFTLLNSILTALVLGGVLILDEADQSLHPTLLRSIILLFQGRETNPRRAQLLFNTHDTTLLNPDTVRPDEIWFMDRGVDYTSRVYCLADFEGIRSDTKTQRAYLDGRFGALPFLEEQSRLFSDTIDELSRGL